MSGGGKRGFDDDDDDNDDDRFLFLSFLFSLSLFSIFIFYFLQKQNFSFAFLNLQHVYLAPPTFQNFYPFPSHLAPPSISFYFSLYLALFITWISTPYIYMYLKQKSSLGALAPAAASRKRRKKRGEDNKREKWGREKGETGREGKEKGKIKVLFYTNYTLSVVSSQLISAFFLPIF